MSTTLLQTPSAQSSVTSLEGQMSMPWFKFLRDLVSQSNAECTPGRVAMFELSAADLADATKFIQSGATAGLGVGRFLGWAYCNGNNATTDRVAEFAAFTTLAPLMRV